MRTEEIINEINNICKPYNLSSELHCIEAKNYYALLILSGEFPGWDIIEKISGEIEKIKEVDRVYLELGKKK